LTISHELTLEQGREAWHQLKEGSEDFRRWMRVGEALKLLRDDAQRRAGNHTTGRFFNRIMGELLKQHRFDDIDKAARSRLLTIIDNKTKVNEWLATLTREQRLQWSHPTVVYRHCPLFKKPVDPNKPKRETLREASAKVQEELKTTKEQLKRAGTGSNIDFEKDTDANIVNFLAHGLVTARRIRRIIHGLQTKARELEKQEKAAKPAAKASSEPPTDAAAQLMRGVMAGLDALTEAKRKKE
jgi:hypothetical protein